MLIDIFSLKFFKDITGIIHIGAHDCEERLSYLKRFNSITDDDIIWIDALKSKVEEIQSQNKGIKIFNECISDVDNETINFKVTNNYQSSSILELKEHLLEHPDIHEIEQIEMKTKTLKTFYDENNFDYNRFNFMNLDIQGAELLALKGADKILDNIDFIYIEINTKELYKNCPLVNDIDEYLKKFNFKRFNTYMTPHGWGDAFYCKYKFKLANNFSIEYGSDDVKINVTELTYNRRNNYNISHIPKTNGDCDIIYGDPIHGVVKNIYITSNEIVYKNCSNYNIYIDYKNNTLFIDKIPLHYNLSVMSIFKNETMNLKVWLEHYLWQGVEHFYLIDNGSTDNPLDILNEYIDKGIVTYYYREQKHQQSHHYRFVYDNENIKSKTKWLCICDLDEFFFGIQTKLLDAVESLNNYDVIYTNSFFYGSDNLIEHPSDIRTSILHRNDDTVNGIKYIFKPSCINSSSEIWIHWLVNEGTVQKKHMNETHNNTIIRLNHYPIQSYEYYTKIKMTRGDVSNQESENVRDMKYFEHNRDIATIYDDTLKTVIENNYHQKKVCFITAIYGSYEKTIKSFVKQTIPTDFICFTDNINISNNGWIVDTYPYHYKCKNKLDTNDLVNSFNNNQHTFNIAKYYKQSFQNIPRLKNYDVIIWIDGTIEIIYDKTSEYILDNIYKYKIIGWSHEYRNGILKDEVDESSRYYVYNSKFWNLQNQPIQDVWAQYNEYIKDGYDEEFFKKINNDNPNFGVWITCFVAFLNKDKSVADFLKLWYFQTLKYTTQDQVSFPYVCQKTNIIPYTLPDNNILSPEGPHNKTMFYIKHPHNL